MAPAEDTKSPMGEIITAALDARGWSQAELARRLKVRPQTVNKWISGENVPRPTMVPRLAEELRLDPFRLLALAGYINDGERAVTATISIDPTEDNLVIEDAEEGAVRVYGAGAALAKKVAQLGDRDRAAIEALVDKLLADE